MAEAQASDVEWWKRPSSSGGGDGGGAARTAQRRRPTPLLPSSPAAAGGDGGGAVRKVQGRCPSPLLPSPPTPGGGEERWVTVAPATGSASERAETAYATAAMSEEEIARAIATSRQQGLWSEVPQRSLEAAAPPTPTPRVGGADAVLWEQLKRSHPRMFKDVEEGYLKLGRMIAEGGQAQIYEASHFLNPGGKDFIAKVFKMEGFSLAELERQWPRERITLRTPEELLRLSTDEDNPGGFGAFVFSEMRAYCSLTLMGTYLKDGRFAFVMERYWGDLRTLIDLRLKDNNFQRPPFSPREALTSMCEIARGIRTLHNAGVLHRDMKAANVLISTDGGGDPRCDTFLCIVADYESAMLVVGTGFWRAPEVLEELMKAPWERKDDIWTEKVDTYSYAMTCYEVLTGHIPFYGYMKRDWKRVIDGERPFLPYYIDSRVRDLVKKCWHKDPTKRPCFDAIVDELDILIDS